MQRLVDFITGIDGANKRRMWQRHLDGLPGAVLQGWNDLLSALPDDAWLALKTSTLRQIDHRDPWASWRQAEDRFNEARGFLYLRSQGCDDVAFAASSMAAPGPDLLARRGAVVIACEVKTLHLDATSMHLSRKLRSRLQDAVAQAMAVAADEAYVYLVATGLDAPEIGNTLDVASLAPCRLVVDCDGTVQAFN
ncbi:hypothetical protein [Dongia rigui]|uniref:Uncharacterized protein n=1 Tax=Dongia rigui TaxID=940149 RepID=A0ABU5DY43_9PROT|nr:hypothetical protein [Dongia rigui]MDY0872184.1 hypothetical protein [Dongia rigui]